MYLLPTVLSTEPVEKMTGRRGVPDSEAGCAYLALQGWLIVQWNDAVTLSLAAG